MGLILLLLVLEVTSTATKWGCFYYFKDQNISYEPLSLRNTFEHGFQIDYDNQQGLLHVNVCSEVKVPPECERGFTSALAYFQANNKSICVQIMSRILRENDFGLLDEKNSTAGFFLKDRTGAIRIEIKCNKAMLVPLWLYDKAKKTLKIEASDGCGKVNEAARFTENFHSLLGVAMVGVSLMIGLFGGWKWGIVKYVVTFATGVATFFMIVWFLFDFEFSNGFYVLVLSLAAIVAGALTGLSSKEAKVCNAAFGLGCGYALANIGLVSAQAYMRPYVASMVRIAVAGALGILCSIEIKLLTLILSSFVGPICICYGLGLLFGTAEVFFESVEMRRSGVEVSAGTYFYFVVGFIAFPFVLCYQLKMAKKMRKKKKEEEEEKDEENPKQLKKGLLKDKKEKKDKKSKKDKQRDTMPVFNPLSDI